MSGLTHKAAILQRLLKGERIVSNDVMASNSNQYFREIKLEGIELVEVMEPNINNNGRHKVRSLHQSLDNIRRAEKYLKKLLGRAVKKADKEIAKRAKSKV